MSDFACRILQNSVLADATDKDRAANNNVGFMCPCSRNVPKYTELQKQLLAVKRARV